MKNTQRQSRQFQAPDCGACAERDGLDRLCARAPGPASARRPPPEEGDAVRGRERGANPLEDAKRTMCVERIPADWPAAKIEALRRVLRDEAVAPMDRQAMTLMRTLRHGHGAATLGMLRKLGLDRILPRAAGNLAARWQMIVARLIDPASKLATARGLDDDTATCSLGQVLKLGAADEQEPMKRLVACRSALLAGERARKRCELLDAYKPSAGSNSSSWNVLGPETLSAQSNSDEAGHALQCEAGHVFRSEAGRGSARRRASAGRAHDVSFREHAAVAHALAARSMR
jgi:hypothetical protein